MKVSVLIKRLQKLQSANGDLDVEFYGHMDAFNKISVVLRRAKFGWGYPKSVQKNGATICIIPTDDLDFIN